MSSNNPKKPQGTSLCHRKKSIEFTPEQLRKLQLLQLDILKEFDRICRKHDLTYTLCGGSMLGAIRHRGFIPWDDDIDIAMLRTDYDRFCNLCYSELNTQKYFLQTMDTDPEYRMMFGRILLNGTAFVRVGRENAKCKNGIFIDIFPLDAHSQIAIFRLCQDILSLLMRKILYAPIGSRISPKAFYRAVYSLFCLFPRSVAKKLHSTILALNFHHDSPFVVWYSLMDWREKYWKAKKHHGNEHKKVILNRFTRKSRLFGFQKSFLSDILDLKFEDMNTMVSSHYHQWLQIEFGDYMKLPPPHERIMHQTVSYYSFGIYGE